MRQMMVAWVVTVGILAAPDWAASDTNNPTAGKAAQSSANGSESAKEAGKVDAAQDAMGEKYEPVTSAEYEPNMELRGRIEWDPQGLINGGPVDSLSFWGHKIELVNNMITAGFISTKDFGKIMVKANPGGSMHIELTPSQQKKLKELKKKQ